MPFSIFLQTFQQPTYLAPVVLGLLLAGAIGWLIATVIGFSRARLYGTAVRWFSLAAACLLIYHLQWLVFAFVLAQNTNSALGIGAFFNLFVVLGAVCAIIGFTRLANSN